MIKKIAYIVVALGYFIFMVAFGKEYLLKELAVLPNWLAYFIYTFLGFVLTFVLFVLAIWPYLFKSRKEQKANR